MSQYKQFCEKWKNGCGSSICGGRDGLGTGMKLCFARGCIPCDVLFIGEAPGESENVLGSPFVGPAGHLLDSIVRRSLGDDDSAYSCAFTNLVCCIPREDSGDKATEPCLDDIKQCCERLTEFITICKPRLVVYVGKLAEKHGPIAVSLAVARGVSEIKHCSITHPAAILRANVAQRGLSVQKCVVTLRNAIEELSKDIPCNTN